MTHKDFRKVKYFKLEPYNIDITFAIPKKELCDKFLTGYGRCEFDKKERGIFIFLKDEKVRNSVISHECFHAVEFIMENIGQKFSESPNETWAYLLQYLIDKYEELMK